MNTFVSPINFVLKTFNSEVLPFIRNDKKRGGKGLKTNTKQSKTETIKRLVCKPEKYMRFNQKLEDREGEWMREI